MKQDENKSGMLYANYRNHNLFMIHIDINKKQ